MLETLNPKKLKDFNSCVVEIPKEFALANGFPERCFVSLTMRGGKLESEIIEFNDQDEKEVDEFIEDFPNFGEDLKKIGFLRA